MYLVVGLGNPGRRYAGTRHNVGFRVVDALAKENALKWKRSWRFPAEIAKGYVFGSDLMLAKPRTFMNRSGQAIEPMIRRIPVELSRLVVVLDDVELPCGRIRLRMQGGSGGHNGLKSTIESLESERFFRIRIGVGPKPDRDEMVNFVLSDFSEPESGLIAAAMETAGKAIRTLVEEGPERAMNRFNA